jgi:Obg family GTPase CgtA-like protein
LKRTTKAETLGRRLRFFYRHVERARLLLYLVEGTLPLEIVQRTDFGNHEAVLRMQKRLKGLGVFRRLQELGAQEGDTVRIGDVELEYVPDV